MNGRSLKVAGLFAGVGGVEFGLHAAGHHTELLCEIDPSAQAVLRAHFPDVPLHADVRELRDLPAVDLLAAGFPCQDLSQAGDKVGITGPNSGLVAEVFRLCGGTNPPEWVLLENVSYMLRLGGGSAMQAIVSAFESLGYRWAYRVVDARGFGMPQRRQRVVFLASRDVPPERVLFADVADDRSTDDRVTAPVEAHLAYGFYWTEGLRGLGWTRDAVPTIKGGSRLGIPSPPAVWLVDEGVVGTPSLSDAERLQGFAADWTAPADEVADGARNARWRLVGNAVCVPMAQWVGERLAEPPETAAVEPVAMPARGWPPAAAGGRGTAQSYPVSMRTAAVDSLDLRGFLADPLKPLSERATRGFLTRAKRAKINFPAGLLEAMAAQHEPDAEAS